MNIVFYNKKGGVGKTNLSYCTARALNYYLISNDDSLIEDAYKDFAVISDKILPIIDKLEDKNIIVDLGGFVTEETFDILKKADMIIIPTISDMNSMKRTINTYKEIEELTGTTKNIHIVANIIKSEKDLKFIKDNLGLNVSLSIKESKIFHNALLKQTSIKDLLEKDKLNKHRYRNVLKDFDKLTSLILGNK